MIRCVAIDDEPIALSIIREYCSRYGDIELKCFTSPVAGMDCIQATKPDIVFLDIEMITHNGVSMAKELPADTCLIFTTAYAGYALDGFNVDAIDFLHKPIFYARFEKAMAKAKKYISLAEKNESEACITLKAEHKNVVVALKDVVVIEAMDNYVKVFRNDLPTVVSQITMKEIESMLPADSFLRIHRSFIIALAFVRSFSNRTVYMHGFAAPVPAGRKYISAFNSLEKLIRAKT